MLPSDEQVDGRVASMRAAIADGRIELFGSEAEDPIEIVPPDPAWPAQFAAVLGRIAEALGPVALRIDHVGSTAVPGLAAKPIIDVQVSVADLEVDVAYAAGLASLGWPLRARETEQRFFCDPPGVTRATHVHVCALGSTWERRHLLLRDYLRADSDRARAYGELKIALATRYRHDRVAYTEAKGPFIDETTAMAEAWAATTGWQP